MIISVVRFFAAVMLSVCFFTPSVQAQNSTGDAEGNVVNVNLLTGGIGKITLDRNTVCGGKTIIIRSSSARGIVAVLHGADQSRAIGVKFSLGGGSCEDDAYVVTI